MVGAGNSNELLLGFSPDGLFEIILRLGKFFFQKCFLQIFVLAILKFKFKKFFFL